MKSKKYYLTSAVLFLIFIFFTIIIKTIDVQAIGPNASSIGLADFNIAIFCALGENNFWYSVSEVLGNVALLTALGFACLGVYQFIKRKSIFKVDKSLILLALFYITVIVFYILFEVIIVNYRPVLINGVLEASYPSSHTMLTLCIMGTAIIQFNRLVKSKVVSIFLDILCILIAVFTLIGRLLSGVHWFTDIIGGIILSFALIILYIGVNTKNEKK